RPRHGLFNPEFISQSKRSLLMTGYPPEIRQSDNKPNAKGDRHAPIQNPPAPLRKRKARQQQSETHKGSVIFGESCESGAGSKRKPSRPFIRPQPKKGK